MTVQAGSPEWLEARRVGLGGSDAPALYGLGFGTELSVWMSKVHPEARLEPSIQQARELYFGRLFEDDGVEAYAAFTGRLVGPGVTMAKHATLPAIANTDGTVRVDASGDEGVLEIKNPIPATLDQWDEGVPMHVQVQVQHYLMVLGQSWTSVGAIMPRYGGHELAWWDLERHERFIEALAEKEQRWWDRHVVGGEPPEPTGKPIDKKALKMLYPKDRGTVIDLSPGGIERAQRLREVNKALSALNKEKDELTNALKAEMMENAYGVLPDGSGIACTTSERAEYVVPAKVIRTMRFASAKTIKRAKGGK